MDRMDAGLISILFLSGLSAAVFCLLLHRAYVGELGFGPRMILRRRDRPILFWCVAGTRLTCSSDGKRTKCCYS